MLLMTRLHRSSESHHGRHVAAVGPREIIREKNMVGGVYRAAAKSTDEPSGVSTGLNLWLELEDPSRMGELLLKLLDAQQAIRTALTNLHYVHFARFVPTPPRKDFAALQVITEFDGEFDAYLLDFVLVLADEFEMILSFIKDRPRSPVKDHPAEFLQFIRERDLGYGQLGGHGIGLYSAYPQRTVIDLVGASGVAPAAAKVDPVAVDRSDVQANVLRGIRANCAWYVGLWFGAAHGAFALLDELLTGTPGTLCVSNDNQRLHTCESSDYVLTIGLSHLGLLALGISADDQKAFAMAHTAFVRGPDQREIANSVGDIGASHPANWQLGGPYPVHMVVSLYANDAACLKEKSESLLQRCKVHCVSIVNKQWSATTLYSDATPKPRRVMHFGYVDSISQPRLAITGEPDVGNDMQPRAGVGEFLLGAGYRNIFGGQNSLGGLSPALGQNATFAALRIMEQDVVGFERMLDEACLNHNVHREWLAAKLMGRWRDGTPLALSPDRPSNEPNGRPSNQFDYLPSVDHPGVEDDSAGFRCPLGAHVRRMNPRSSRVAGRAYSRRMLRRGMPYGPKYEATSKTDDEPRGLVGLFLCADLERQFEFILREWTQGDRATSGLVGQQDPIIGAQASLEAGQAITGEYRIPMREGRADIVLKMPRLVKTVASVYLFMPGISGLRYLASLGKSRRQSFDHALPSFETWPATNTSCDGPSVAPVDPKTFDPRFKGFRDNPFPAYASLRQHTKGMVKVESMNSTWVLSYRYVDEIARDPEAFRKRSSHNTSPTGLLTMDPPFHDKCRVTIERLFNEVRRETAGNIPEIVSKCYQDRCKNKGQTHALDWIAEFAQPVAQAVFFDLFGLTVPQAASVIRQVEEVLALVTPADDAKVSDEIAAKQKQLASTLLFTKLRPMCAPRRLFDRILGLTEVFDTRSNKDAPPLTAVQVEQLANAATLAMAGFLPLQWFIALATWRLLENKGVLLQQLESHERIHDRHVIDELLRFDTPTPFSDRFVAADCTFHGVQLTKDQRVTLVWASANRDESDTGFGKNAGAIDFNRGHRKPDFAFGAAGTRNCLGREMVYEVMAEVISALCKADPTPCLARNFVPTWGTFNEGAMFRAMTALMVHC
jgi:cytochrome P450/deferrochelatase/peroxidase EfeB